MNKLRLYISIFILIVFSFLSAQGQSYTINKYFNDLNSNLLNSGLDNKDLDNYCKAQDEKINPNLSNKLDNTVFIGEEEYHLSETAFEYYHGFESMQDLNKCRLLYLWNKLSKTIYQVVESQNLPKAIAYLPIAYTALNNNYTSSDYRFGVWGLPYIIGVKYGLVADSCYDERLDLTLNSFASLSHLKELYYMFGSWDMTITAYCCGVVSVKNAQTNNNTFESVYNKMNSENKDSFYRLIAITKWMSENEKIETNQNYFSSISVADTVIVADLINFNQIAEVLNIDKNTLKELNPSYTGDYIDGRRSAKVINIPQSYKMKYLKNRDSIRFYMDSIYFPKYIPNYSSYKNNGYSSGNDYVSISPGKDYEEIKYKIVSGDNLGSIAERYDVRVTDLKDWNNISGTNIYAGKTISIWVKKGTKHKYTQIAYSGKSSKNKSSKSNKTRKVFSMQDYKFVETYEIKSGDSPFTIAKKYDWATPEDIMNWNQISDPSKLQIGQKLKIFKKKNEN